MSPLYANRHVNISIRSSNTLFSVVTFLSPVTVAGVNVAPARVLNHAPPSAPSLGGARDLPRAHGFRYDVVRLQIFETIGSPNVTVVMSFDFAHVYLPIRQLLRKVRVQNHFNQPLPLLALEVHGAQRPCQLPQIKVRVHLTAL